ncbi:MAG TPA: TonB-dependent receptor [Candidatus Eisenbacteria bacterium]|nr:TonB-dependent receptor [Candidatus Eisenbacteria bacterium]
MGPLRSAPLALASVLATLILATPIRSHAQEPVPPPPPPAGADSAAAKATEAPGSATAVPAVAEEPRYHLRPVVVTGERTPLPLDRVPLDVTVIDEERLEAQRPLLLAEALRQVPAVDVQRSGSPGKLTDVRLRGADPRHTLVLFDGVPLNGPWLGTFDFADFTDPGIRRVEVLGGPASSLYGSGAVGGVIQLLTRVEGEPSAPERLRAFAEYGDGETFRGNALWSGMAGSMPVGLSVTHLGSDGFRERDGYAGWNATARLDAIAGASNRIRVSAFATGAEKELPYDFTFDGADTTLSPFGSSKQVADPNYDETDRVLAGTAAWKRAVAPGAEVEAEVSGLYGRIENDNGPNSPGGDFQDTDLSNTRGIGALRARVEPSAGLSLLAGAEYRGEHVDRSDRSSFFGFESDTAFERSVHARSLYGQLHAEWGGRVVADAGIRLDDHSRHGSYGLPRVAAGIRWHETGVTFRGGYGRAFTAPSLSDLYYPGYSADSLRPERSTTWELGADASWLGGRLAVSATHHHTEFQDLIQSSSFFVPENIGRARIEGQDYSLRVIPHARLTLRAGAAHLIAVDTTDPEDEPDPDDPDRRLSKRPEWRFTASGEITATRALTVTGAWRWVDPVRDPFDFIDVEGNVLRGDTPGYAALDLGASLSLQQWMPARATVRVTNALDRDYSEVKGFPAPGRAVTAGLTVGSW